MRQLYFLLLSSPFILLFAFVLNDLIKDLLFEYFGFLVNNKGGLKLISFYGTEVIGAIILAILFLKFQGKLWHLILIVIFYEVFRTLDGMFCYSQEVRLHIGSCCYPPGYTDDFKVTSFSGYFDYAINHGGSGIFQYISSKILQFVIWIGIPLITLFLRRKVRTKSNSSLLDESENNER